MEISKVYMTNPEGVSYTVSTTSIYDGFGNSTVNGILSKVENYKSVNYTISDPENKISTQVTCIVDSNVEPTIVTDIGQIIFPSKDVLTSSIKNKISRSWITNYLYIAYTMYSNADRTVYRLVRTKDEKTFYQSYISKGNVVSIPIEQIFESELVSGKEKVILNDFREEGFEVFIEIVCMGENPVQRTIYCVKRSHCESTKNPKLITTSSFVNIYENEEDIESKECDIVEIRDRFIKGARMLKRYNNIITKIARKKEIISVTFEYLFEFGWDAGMSIISSKIGGNKPIIGKVFDIVSSLGKGVVKGGIEKILR